MYNIVSPLSAYYRELAYHVIEPDGLLWVGFKSGMVRFTAKEVWNIRPLTRTDVERYYEEFTMLIRGEGSLCFRIVAHGGLLKEVLVYESYGLAISDDSYLRSLNSGGHAEPYPHNEKAYRAIVKGFEQYRIGTAVQAIGTGRSCLLARYISEHATERICVFALNVIILEKVRKTVGFTFPYICYRMLQSLVYYRKNDKQLKTDHILVDEFHHFGAETWGAALQEVIESDPQACILGTSATPIRSGGTINTVDLYLEGSLFYELTLPQAWYYRILPAPILVQSAYELDGELSRLQKRLDRNGCSIRREKRVQKKLDVARVDFKGTLGAPEIIRKFLPKDVYKLLVFCRDLTDLKQMVPEACGWLTQTG